MDNVRQDLAAKDMDLRTALDTIRDRGKWSKNFIVGEYLTEKKTRRRRSGH